MPCCLIPAQNNPVFPPTLQPDAERFAKYVGGAPLGNGLDAVGDPGPTTVLTSALHLEMKLWQPTKFKYRPNDAEWNSWEVMLVVMGKNTFVAAEKRSIFVAISTLPQLKYVCALIEFYGWQLSTILSLMSDGRRRAPVRNPPGGDQAVAALASVGRCQKLINIYLKYEICWQVTGQWIGGRMAPYPVRIPALPQFLCALHAPIDRILLSAIRLTPLGNWLHGKGLMSKSGTELTQSYDGLPRPWSKLDCLRTYYGLQLMLRRVAMSTWASGCACGGDAGDHPAKAAEELTRKCAEWFNEAYPINQPCQGPDWVEAACELDETVIKETIRQLSDGCGIENSAGREADRPQCDSRPVGGAKGNRASGPRLPKGIPTDAGSQLPKQVIFLKEQSRRGGPHQSALKIVAACDSARNLGAICYKHHCLDAHQELVRLIACAGGNLMQELPQCRVAGLCPTGQKPDGETCCWGGSGYVIGIHFETTEAAVHYLKNYFDVRGCPGNKTWVAGKIQQA